MPLVALVYPSQDEALIKGRVIGPTWNTPDEARQELQRELKSARDRGVAQDVAGYLVEVDGQYRVQKVTRATRATNGHNGHANPGPTARESVSWSMLVEKAKAHLAMLAEKSSKEEALKAVLAASDMSRKQLRDIVDEVAPAPEPKAQTAEQLVHAAERKAMKRWDVAVAEDFPALTQASVEEIAAQAARKAGPDATPEKLDVALKSAATELADVQKMVHDHVQKVGTERAVQGVHALLQKDGSWAGQQAGRLLKEMLVQCPECPGPHRLPKQLEVALPDPRPRTPKEQIPLSFERAAWAIAQQAATHRAEKARAPVPPVEPEGEAPSGDVERRRAGREKREAAKTPVSLQAVRESRDKAAENVLSPEEIELVHGKAPAKAELQRWTGRQYAIQPVRDAGLSEDRIRKVKGEKLWEVLGDDGEPLTREQFSKLGEGRGISGFESWRKKPEPEKAPEPADQVAPAPTHFDWRAHMGPRPNDIPEGLWTVIITQIGKAQPANEGELEHAKVLLLEKVRARMKGKGAEPEKPRELSWGPAPSDAGHYAYGNPFKTHAGRWGAIEPADEGGWRAVGYSDSRSFEHLGPETALGTYKTTTPDPEYSDATGILVFGAAPLARRAVELWVQTGKMPELTGGGVVVR